MQALTAQPLGVFRGKNFVTPDVEGYYRATVQCRSVYVELSSGRGIFDPSSRIYGVTVRLGNGEHLDPDPSAGGFATRAAALRYMEDLEHPAVGIPS